MADGPFNPKLKDSSAVDGGALLAIIAVAGVLSMALVRLTHPKGVFSRGSGKIPKYFSVADVPDGQIPADARRPLTYLTDKLTKLGFVRADIPVHVPAMQTYRRQLLLVPFVHTDEQCMFIMGIESRWPPRSELMLHLITPLADGRRVETSTLGALQQIRPPANVDLRVVLDADTVEEIWSRHRRALSLYERRERMDIELDEWRVLMAITYEGWLAAALRAQRLSLNKDGLTYRLRPLA